MRILAAAFKREDTAVAAFRELNRRFAASRGFRIAPLGRAGDPEGPTTVIAGSFEDDVVAAIKAAVEDLGGDVVIDIDQRAAGR